MTEPKLKWIEASDVVDEGWYWINDGDEVYIRYIREYSGDMCIVNWKIDSKYLYQKVKDFDL